MNIAFFIPELSSKGGAEIYLSKVVAELSRKHDLKVYTMLYDECIFPELKDHVVDLGLPWLARRVHGLKVSAIVGINAVKAISKKIPQGHDLYNVHIFPSNFISEHKPMIWTAQEPPRMLYDLQQEIIDELNGFQKLVARAYFPILRGWDQNETRRNIDQIIANSEYAGKYIKSLYDKKVNVIYPGVDKKFFRVRNKPEKILLSVGRLYGMKRVDLVIKAFKELLEKKPEYKLEVIGEGPMRGELELLAKKLRIEKKVNFRGEVSEQGLINAYKRASALLYYPLREMFGMVPIEAMASGVPVVAVNQGGFTEVVGKTARLTKPQPRVIAEETLRVLKNRKTITKKARKKVKGLTWAKTARETIKVFKDAMTS